MPKERSDSATLVGNISENLFSRKVCENLFRKSFSFIRHCFYLQCMVWFMILKSHQSLKCSMFPEWFRCQYTYPAIFLVPLRSTVTSNCIFVLNLVEQLLLTVHCRIHTHTLVSPWLHIFYTDTKFLFRSWFHVIVGQNGFVFWLSIGPSQFLILLLGFIKNAVLLVMFHRQW